MSWATKERQNVPFDPEQIKSRIQIQDILLDEGIDLGKGRCRCPIHQGNNPTSLSFNDRTYYCYSCGSKGDVITLVAELYRLNFKDALKYLAQKAGLSQNQTATQKKPCHKSRTKGLSAAELKLSIVQAQQNICTRKLKNLRKKLKNGEISFGEYLWETQKLDAALEGIGGVCMGLDASASLYAFEANQMKKNRRR